MEYKDFIIAVKLKILSIENILINNIMNMAKKNLLSNFIWKENWITKKDITLIKKYVKDSIREKLQKSDKKTTLFEIIDEWNIWVDRYFVKYQIINKLWDIDSLIENYKQDWLNQSTPEEYWKEMKEYKKLLIDDITNIFEWIFIFTKEYNFDFNWNKKITLMCKNEGGMNVEYNKTFKRYEAKNNYISSWTGIDILSMIK